VQLEIATTSQHSQFIGFMADEKINIVRDILMLQNKGSTKDPQKCIFGKMANNEGNKELCLLGCYAAWLL
jgi:hypothetical protein